MPNFFQYYFGIEDVGMDETAVCCPFPHTTENGIEYFETNPSAHVNIKNKLFHCKVCGAGYSEASFIKAVLQCTYVNATRLAKAFANDETVATWDKYTTIDDNTIALCKSFGISEEAIDELKIRKSDAGGILVPVLYKNKLLDIRTYVPNGNPKVKSRTNACYGLVIPYDLWESSPTTRITLICAGEKDMAVARSQGFNAITITGGENTLPLSPTWFANRDVVIVYDHDNAGINGAHKLATYLLPFCNTVRVCTGFHEICKEDKEDITDFFTKYHGTREQLISYMQKTPVFTEELAMKSDTSIPFISLQEATTPKYVNRLVRSNIQVAAISEVQFVAPATIVGEKVRNVDSNDTMSVGEMREWVLTDDTVQDILHLVDNNFKETDINDNAKTKLLHILKNEKYIKLNKYDKVVVYKAYVTEMLESVNTNNTVPMEYTAYSVGTRLESGKKYAVTYKLVPHPYKGQQLVMMITNAIHANDSVSKFSIVPETKEALKEIQSVPGTVAEKINTIVQKFKGILGYNGNDTLIQAIDLAYHTVLSFNFGQFKNVRGYLDALIVGESRVGKSSTAEAMRNTYQLGTFTSLAGNSATIPGLIGGSNKTAGGAYQTKAGLIPQNHKGLIIFEEFGKCNTGLVTELTDIRSSNEVRITRISGTLTLPAMVRMISLSNVKSTGSEIKSIASYPNGIAIITELVSTAEDIARYDLLVVLSDKGNTVIDPFWQPETPFSKEAYQTRVRWVWSRTPEQIIIDQEVGHYIINCANELNASYNCHIKIFGTEAWKKLSRLAIAIAGYVVSTDASYENIIVTKEHVDYAVTLYKTLYDNPTFRLKEYVASERKYNEIDQEGIKLLELLYTKCPAMIIMLEQEAKISRNTMMAAVGLDNATYNGFMNQLIRGSFVKLIGSDILPTERFRLGMVRVNRNGTLTRLGENNV